MVAPWMIGAFMVAVPTYEALAAVPPCGAGVAVDFDRAGSANDGEPQSGVLLVLRNVGSAACSIPGLPKLLYEDETGHALEVLRKPPPGMHPGPVITPLILAPGASVSAALHWVSTNPNGEHHCAAPHKVVIGEGPHAPSVAWRFGQLCGEPGKPLSFSQAVLKPASVR